METSSNLLHFHAYNLSSDLQLHKQLRKDKKINVWSHKNFKQPQF
jgi:hypothetical protein